MEREHEKMSWFSLLPEGCLSTIISFTSPKDACRFAILSHAFKFAAESDAVWARFLPSDYGDIIARSSSPLIFNSKKQLYFHLCDHPILLDDGKLSFKLSKATGKKCYMLCARELGIIWGGTPQYWNWTSNPESRFSEVAELVAVCWLEIRGKIRAEILSLRTAYAAYLVFKFKGGNFGLDCPFKALIRFCQDDEVRFELGHDLDARTVYLKGQSLESRRRWVPEISVLETLHDGSRAQRRTDGWMEIKLGEFFSNHEVEVEMMFWEIKYGHWKQGLIVEGIELRPVEEA